MIKGKTQLVFGSENILPKGIDAKASKSVRLKKEREVADKFASYLQSESTAVSTPPSSLSEKKKFTLLSSESNSNIFKNSKLGEAKGVSSHFGGRYSIGSEDTRQGVSPRELLSRNTRLSSSQSARIPAGTLNKGFTVNQGTMEKALASSTTPLRTLNSMSQSMKSAYVAATSSKGRSATSSALPAINSAKTQSSGLNLSNGSRALVFQNKKGKSHGGMTFDYTFSSGQETKNLLQAFKKAEITLKNNDVKVAESPYKSITVKKTSIPLYAKGAAALGFTGKYVENGASYQNNVTSQQSHSQSSSTGYTGSLGSLSAKFESGEMGSEAVGYDRHGGTSYGKFQISSRAGTMKTFIHYLKTTAPDIAERLSKAGPANTGSRNGRMPTEWRAIAKEQPERFETLQNNFIQKSHFEPAMTALTDVGGINFEGLSPALKEVIFSTAVQHGVSGAAKIIDKAVQRVGTNKLHEALSEGKGGDAEQALIRNIYAIRSRQFGSSSNRVRMAVKSRLRNEMKDALSLLKETTAKSIASASFATAQNVVDTASFKAKSA